MRVRSVTEIGLCSLLSIHFSGLSLLPGILHTWHGPFLASGTVLPSKKDFGTYRPRGLQRVMKTQTSSLFFRIVIVIQVLCSTETSDHIAQTSDHIFLFKVIYEFYLIALHNVPLNNCHYPGSELWSGGRLRVTAKVTAGWRTRARGSRAELRPLPVLFVMRCVPSLLTLVA